MATLFYAAAQGLVDVPSSPFSAHDPLSLAAIRVHGFHLRLWFFSRPICDAPYPSGVCRRRSQRDSLH